jgi:hypothetical protein
MHNQLPPELRVTRGAGAGALRAGLIALLATGGCGASTVGDGAVGGGDDLAIHAPAPDAGQPRGGGDGSVDPGGSSDMNCGGMQFAASRVAPNVMLVLDRSDSMKQPIAPGSPTSKWQDLTAAMDTVIAQYDPQVRFGLDMFPDANATKMKCFPGSIAVACGPATGAQVKAAIGASMLFLGTPTAKTLDVVIKSGLLTDPGRDNVVVLATDGLPNCGDVDVAARITALYNAKPPVKTYVIGVGGDTASNPTLLNQWAVDGHTDRPGPTKYYQANSPKDLTDAFNTIAAGVVSCTFQLGQAAPDPMQLYVWENGKMVKADAVNGFTYDANGPSVTLHGMACDQLKSDPTTKVQVIYGCPNAPGIG